VIIQDFDYDRGVKVYNAGDIVTIKGDRSKGEQDERGIVALAWDDGSFSVIKAEGYIGLGERVRTEPTGEHFDLSPLFERLNAGDLQERPGGEFKIGDLVIHDSDEPAVVFYVFEDGKDLATLAVDGMHLCAPTSDIKATGERFDLTPMFDRLKGGNPFEDHKA
jgi:hypothetical protein